jgi:hypothetical protein
VRAGSFLVCCFVCSGRLLVELDRRAESLLDDDEAELARDRKKLLIELVRGQRSVPARGDERTHAGIEDELAASEITERLCDLGKVRVDERRTMLDRRTYPAELLTRNSARQQERSDGCGDGRGDFSCGHVHDAAAVRSATVIRCSRRLCP